MHVNPTIEHGGGIFANTGVDHSLSSWMVLDELSDIVDNTCDGDKTTSVLGLVLEVIPFHDWERFERNTPVKLRTLLIEFLLQLLNTALLDFVALELFQVERKAKLLPHPDRPFRRVVLPKFDGVTVVGGELMMEVVVALTESDESGDHMVTRRVAVVEWLITEPVSQRVDAKGGLLHEEDAEDAAIDEAAEVVTPTHSTDDAGEDETHKKDHFQVVLVLPNDDRILVEI